MALGVFETMDIPTITVNQMKEVDRLVVEEFGILLLQMMENAGRILAELCIELHEPAQVTVLVGPGNNGGGGLVASRYLFNKGVDVVTVLVDVELGKVPTHNLWALRKLGVPVLNAMEGDEEGIIVDALLGYNQQGRPRGRVGELLDDALDTGLPVVSLDVPTGFDMGTGEFHDRSFQGSSVLTLGLPKEHMLGKIHEMWVADIGIPPEVYERVGVRLPPLFRNTDHIRIERPVLW